jgi:gamma-glutamyl:cysteine ligase YbdK (ATP-grasp superfamily)
MAGAAVAAPGQGGAGAGRSPTAAHTHEEVASVGLTIDRDRFDEADHARFAERLRRCLLALERLLEQPGFGVGEATLGAELELSLVDPTGRPLLLNEQVREATADERVTLELDRFNLEINTRPVAFAGRPFAALGRELTGTLDVVRRAAAAHGGRVAVIGILPTLRPGDVLGGSITDAARYRALNNSLRELRQEPFEVAIDGADPLRMTCDDVSLEGANTSYQVHLRVDPGEFTGVYNAAQLATGPVLAVAGNSPTLLGHRLWEETRIALFEQAVDQRTGSERSRRAARVAFGSGWVREGALELFRESVRVHEPVLPVLAEEDCLELAAAGKAPGLEELRLHQGTVWRWNRAIYDPAGGGHLRVELRALPAGPTVTDMLANTAFLLGLTLELAPRIDALTRALPFEQVHHDFYRAAREGLDARLTWPAGAGADAALKTMTAVELAARLLPVARQGLVGAGVDPQEADRLLGVVEGRIAARQTGAVWQRRALAALEPALGRQAALVAMLERYLEHAASDEPVHTWPTAP